MGMFDGKSQKELATKQTHATKELAEFAKQIEARNRHVATQYEFGAQTAREAAYEQYKRQQEALYNQAHIAAVQQQQMLGNTGMAGLLGGLGSHASQTVAVDPTPPVTADSLNSDPVYGPSLEALRDLWLARWGDGWTTLSSATPGDDGRYWFAVLTRLERAYMLERHPNGNFFKIR